MLNVILGFVDILAITLAFQLSYFIIYHNTGGFFFANERFLALFIFVMPFWLLALYLIKVTEIPRTKRYSVLFIEYFQSALAVGIVLLIFYFAFKMVWISRLFLVALAIFGFLLLFTVRFIEYKVFKSYRAKGFNYINVVLLADDTSIPLIKSLIEHKEWGYKISAIFTGSERLGEMFERTSIVGPKYYLGALNKLMEEEIIDEVLYIRSKVVPGEVRAAIRSCEELGVIFSLWDKDIRNNNLNNAIKTNIGDAKFLTFINIPHNSFALLVKHIMDINISLVMIIFLLPVIVILALIIKFSSPGPVVYRQTRVGLRGRKFSLYKFRTMVANAESLKKDLEHANEVDGPVFKIKDDPRITKVGKFLRKTGLDELPQLFNVLKGEMSLIGPRPPIYEETLQYKRWQLRRLSVKPGLSCFWQIKANRNNIKFEEWMELDLAYIDNWSLRLDFVILVKTVKTVFKRSGL